MALIIRPEGVHVAGSVAGTCSQRGNVGSVVRNRSLPVRKRSSRQAASRVFFGSLTIAWQTELTQAQRASWRVYAANVPWKNRLGSPATLAGVTHFVRSNLPRLLAGLPRVDVAPGLFGLADAPRFLSAVGSAATNVVWLGFSPADPWQVEPGAFLASRLTLPQNSAVSYPKRLARSLPSILGDDVSPPSIPHVLSAPYAFAQSQRLWLSARIGRADGRLSEPTSLSFRRSA